ncbi:MAG: pirin family protein [Phycisphaerales bacterium]
MTQTTTNPITFLPGDQRGTTQIGWLYSRHSFSFGRYYDPAKMGYRSLRVINDDVISPGTGFGEHGHDNMEILTWVVDGALRHGDSLGHSQRLEPGELQAMSAGSGIRHSEYNDSSSKPVRLLQIWIEPAKHNTEPRYDSRVSRPKAGTTAGKRWPRAWARKAHYRSARTPRCVWPSWIKARHLTWMSRPNVTPTSRS